MTAADVMGVTPPAPAPLPGTPGTQGTLRETVVAQQCQALHLPTIAGQSGRLAIQAERERQPYLGYLEALLGAELEDRERRAIERRIKDAHLPRVKTLEEFDFSQAPAVSPTRLATLAEGGYITRAEPVVLLGDCGTGKTHLLTALCGAAGAAHASATGCASPPPPRWSRSWWKPSSNWGSSGCWPAGRAMTWSPVTKWATCPWPSWAPSSSFRSSPSVPRTRRCCSRRTCPSPSGRRSSPTPASVRHCWTASPTAPTSLKPAPSPTASGARWPNARTGTAPQGLQGNAASRHRVRHNEDRWLSVSQLSLRNALHRRRLPMQTDPHSPSRNDDVTMADGGCRAAPACPVCGVAFPPAGRRRFCSDACRQAAFRHRHASGPAGPTSAVLRSVAGRMPPTPALAAHPKHATVYECPVCGNRLLGEQRCPECNVFCRRIGPGGSCPHCDEPVAVAALITSTTHERS